MALALVAEELGNPQGLEVVWPHLQPAILAALEGARVTRTLEMTDQDTADTDDSDGSEG